MIDAARSLVRHLLPHAEIQETGHAEHLTFRLPWPEDGEYRFAATVEGEEANLLGERRGGATGEYFWYHPFEDAAFANVSDLFAAFHRELALVITHPTRIIQRRRLVTWEFECESFAPGGWQRVYTHGVLRGTARVPSITGVRQVYTAAALARSFPAADVRGA